MRHDRQGQALPAEAQGGRVGAIGRESVEARRVAEPSSNKSNPKSGSATGWTPTRSGTLARALRATVGEEPEVEVALA